LDGEVKLCKNVHQK